MGSANFPENVILAEIYAQALQAQGATVRRSSTSAPGRSTGRLSSFGSIDLSPEYTGSILAFIDEGNTATSPDDVYAALGKALPPTLTQLDMAEAQDSDAVVVNKATADKYNLKTIADLAKKN